MQTSRRDRTITPKNGRGFVSEKFHSKVMNEVRQVSLEAKMGLKAACRHQMEQLKSQLGE